MIDPQKVRAIARTTLYEHNEGRVTLKLKEYSEDLPVWKGLSRSALAGVLLYVLILLIALLAFPEWFTALNEELGDLAIAIFAAASLAIFAVAYSVLSDIIFRTRYKKRRSSLCRYESDQRRLFRMEREQDKA